MTEIVEERLPFGVPSPVRVVDSAVLIGLGHGFVATVDLSDIAAIEGKRWLPLMTHTGHVYAYMRTKKNPIILMHRLLLDAPRGMQVDHADGDGLNNRRSNIRLATPTQNMANRGHDRRNLLGVKGVSKIYNKYRATITPDGKKVYLGTFATAEEAHAAYLGAARVLWGKFARGD